MPTSFDTRSLSKFMLSCPRLLAKNVKCLVKLLVLPSLAGGILGAQGLTPSTQRQNCFCGAKVGGKDGISKKTAEHLEFLQKSLAVFGAKKKLEIFF